MDLLCVCLFTMKKTKVEEENGKREENGARAIFFGETAWNYIDFSAGAECSFTIIVASIYLFL